jgi:multidrug resistance efflux pump
MSRTTDPCAQPERSPRRGRVRFVIVLVLVMMIGTVLVHRALSSGPGGAVQRPEAGARQSVAARDAEKLVVCFGYADLEAGVTNLHPSQVGRVMEVPVRENDTVAAGSVLLRLDDRAAQNKVEEARAVLEEAIARLAKAEEAPEQHRLRIVEQRAMRNAAKYRLASAQHTLQGRRTQMRIESIGRKRDDPVTTEEVASTAERIKEFEEVLNEEETRLKALEAQNPEADVARVRAEVSTVRARLHDAERVLDEHTLRAPKAGKVLRIFVTLGELLTSPPKRTAIQFCPDEPRIIRSEIDQAFASRVVVGLPAVAQDDSATGPTWRGRVVRISDWYTQRRQVADEVLQLRDIRTLECLIGLDADQPALRIGQRVHVTILRAR